jgi:hypothetical protein
MALVILFGSGNRVASKVWSESGKFIWHINSLSFEWFMNFCFRLWHSRCRIIHSSFLFLIRSCTPLTQFSLFSVKLHSFLFFSHSIFIFLCEVTWLFILPFCSFVMLWEL